MSEESRRWPLVKADRHIAQCRRDRGRRCLPFYFKNSKEEICTEYGRNVPIAFTRLLVAMIKTFLRCFNLSSWVRRAFTTCFHLAVVEEGYPVLYMPTRSPSEGSVPAIAPARAAVSDSTSSVMLLNSLRRIY